jgi:hypothetical protein
VKLALRKQIDMNDQNYDRVCDVCEINPGKVMPSGMAPVSYVRCTTCREAGIELLGVVLYHLYVSGGPGKALEGIQADWWKTVKSFDDGSYLGWNEICELYPDFAAECEREEQEEGEDDQ